MTLFLAMILDAALGEPKWLWSRFPHPVVIMGNLIAWCDRRFNRGPDRRIKGVMVIVALVVGSALFGGLVTLFLGNLADIIIIAILLAQRSLVDHVSAVATALAHSTEAARTAVAQIVGRDTADMDPPAISRAALESAAENLSDGVIAPAFWALIGGLPGILAYKMINTADSMIGYRTAKYEEFGWAAARIDDLVNLIPARLTALLLWLPRRQGMWADIAADARQHRSPNAGWPEAALARGLNVALAGPRVYDGHLRDLAWVHESGDHNADQTDIARGVDAIWAAWGLALGAVLVIALI